MRMRFARLGSGLWGGFDLGRNLDARGRLEFCLGRRGGFGHSELSDAGFAAPVMQVLWKAVTLVSGDFA